MKSLWPSGLALLLTLSFASCGGGSSNNTQPPPPPPPAVSISLSESAVTMTTSNPDYHVASTHTFTATVHNAANSSVTWKVNGMVGGDSSTGHGTISTAGVYTAPIGILSDGVIITATSVHDPTKSASATVTLNWYVDAIYVNANGNSTQVKTGEQLQFNATVTTLGPTSVTWDVNGVRVGNSTIGALLRSNYFGPTAVTYVAPHTPGIFTITATSDANPTKSTSLPIKVVASDPTEASISISPNDANLELAKKLQFTAALTNADGWVSWGLARDENGQLANGYLTGDGSTYNAPFEMPTGADQVVTACINGYTTKCGYAVIHLKPPAVDPNTRVQGNYVMTLHDRTYGMNLLGLISADGAGKLQGTADLNAGVIVATALSFNGTYKLGVDGRGSASITYTPFPGTNVNMNVRIMMVSDNLGYLFSNDQNLGEALGLIEKQTASSFSNTDLNGSYAFLLRGLAPQGQPVTDNYFAGVGTLKFNPDGTLSGSGDTAGVPLYQTISGTYSLQTNGVGTATLDFGNAVMQYPSNAHFIMVSPNKFYLLTTDDITSVSSAWPLLAGTAEKQSGVFDTSTLSGSYAVYDTGRGWTRLMRFDINGTGTLSNGFADERDSSGTGNVSVKTGVVFNGAALYDAQTNNGRVNVGFNYGLRTEQLKFYLISPSKFYVLAPNAPVPSAGEGYTQTAGTMFDWSAVEGRYAVQSKGYGYDGVGWMMPMGYGDMQSQWIGWLDYDTNVRAEVNPQFYRLEGFGTGRCMLDPSGPGFVTMRYLVVSESKILMMSMFTGNQDNVFATIDKLQPID